MSDPDKNYKKDIFEDESSSSLIKMLRTSSGLTQAELAEKVGMTPSMICRLENPNYDSPTLGTLKRIGEALGYDLKIRFSEIPRD